MSLFRRRTPSVGRPDNSAPSASALTGATQAFLKSQASNASLSNAAAAAALRSHATSPIPVGDVQTRRMLHRQNSNSSIGSEARPPSRGRGAPLLQRQNSSGSMTERTFRDPSPARPASRNAVENPPPVPRVPDAYNSQNFPPPPPKSHRRATSMEPLPRVMSPPNVSGGRGLSLDRKLGQPPGRPPGQKAKQQRVTSLENVEELERTDSRNSINFSYPNRARPNSATPPASPISPISPPISNKKTRPVSTPGPSKPAQVLSPAETANVQYAVTEAASKPVKKKKKVVAREVGEGSHLSSGAAGGRPAGTALNASSAQIAAMAAPARTTREALAAQPQPAAEPPKKPKKKKSKPKVTEPLSQEYQPGHNRYGSYTSESDSASERESQTNARPQSTRASGQLQKQPSIVREDWEGEEQAALYNGTQSSTTAPAVESPASAAEPVPRLKTKRPATANTSKKYAETPSQPSSSSPLPAVSQPQLPPTLITTIPSPELNFPLANNHLSPKENGNVQAGRPQSLSPSRQAHFANYIKVDDPNEPKHQPPPRSVSPAKSAMKHHSPSPQALSPSDLMPGSWSRGPPSEASDSVISDEGSKAIPKKRKSVRVSFNEEAAVAGAESSQTINPQEPPAQDVEPKDPAKRSWSNPNRGKAPQTSDDVDDVMKPMPALPSFGSIRQRKAPSDNLTPVSSGDTSSTASSVSNQPIQDTSQSVSSDHVIGGILSQDFASKGKEKANHTLSNEPLPPEVTSVEGTGYGSDTDGTDGSIYSVEKDSEVSEKPLLPNSTVSAEDHVASYRELASPVPDTESEIVPLQEAEEVPSIAVHPATPLVEHGDQEGGILVMPGGFPVSTETLEQTPTIIQADEMEPSDPRYDFAPPVNSMTPTIISTTEPQPVPVTPAITSVVEPTPPEAAAHQDPALPAVDTVAPSLSQSLGIQNTEDEDEKSDDTGNSIYSDAAEDVSDFEGDGFGSINAIVGSPMVSPAVKAPPSFPESSPSGTTSSPPDSPIARYIPTKGGPRGITDPASQGSWDAAQSHWSEIKKSRRVSNEAAQQAARVSAAREPLELAAPKSKTKKKKKTVPVNADRSLISTQAARTAPVTSQVAMKSSLKQPAAPTANLRRSMRSEPEPVDEPAHMRQSLRSDGGIRGSMRGPPPQQKAPSKKQQRQSLGAAPPPEPRATLQKRNLRPVSESGNYTTLVQQPKEPAAPKPSKARRASPKSGVSAPLRRTLSNDSNSSSSFKKARVAKPTGERYSMKRSMRSVSTPPVPSSVQESYPSLKRDSSAGARPMSASGGMRSTMRGSVDSTAPSLRNKPRNPTIQERPTSPTSFSFGRKTKEKAPKTAPPKSSSRFRSRLVDSSDEEGGSNVFRSRYADSSDDEPDEPRNLRPVRGIPRKQNEGDSTDLEDSSDGGGAAAPPPQPQPQISSPDSAVAANPSSALAAGSLRNTDLDSDPKKRKGLFGRFRSNREKPGPPSRQVSGLPTTTTTVVGGSPVSPKPPKLTRRVTPKRFNSQTSESWPLPDKEIEVERRPNTSDGVDTAVAAASASNGRARGNTDSTTNTEKGNNTLVGRTKKKRFPMLRKAFGLND